MIVRIGAVFMEKIDDKIYKMRWYILAIVIIEPFMSCLDSSIVNVALPVMANKLSVSMAVIEWVVTSYLIVISATILIFGRLGDIKGKTMIFNFGLILFTAGSLMCGISNTLLLLVISRVIQAIGASAAMATNQGIITQVFPASERGRALGISGAFVALGTMIGPPLGGFIVSILSWHYIFLINVPIGFIMIFFALKILPKRSKVIDEKLDMSGSLLFILFTALLFGSIIQGQETGYSNIFILSGFLSSVIFFISFLFAEKRVKKPLLDLSIFYNVLFSISLICAFIQFTIIGGVNIILPFYLQDALKLSPGSSGLILMVSPVVLLAVAPVSGYMSDKIGSEFLTFVGLILTGTGLLLISTLNEHSNVLYLAVYLGIMSAGNGLFQSPNTSLIMSLVPKNKLGIAGSINALVRNLGLVFGIAASTTLLYNRMSHIMGYHVTNYIEGKAFVFIYGMKYVFVAATILCMAGALITALRLKNKKN